MNPYVYPPGFGRCSFRCSAGPCRQRTGFGTTYGQSCNNTWPVEPTSMGTIWTMHDSLQAQNRWKPISERSTCSSFTHGLYSQSDQGFRYARNWQTRTQSFFIRTVEYNQTQMDAHAISVLLCTLIHISQSFS